MPAITWLTSYSANYDAWVRKSKIQFKPITCSLTSCEDLQPCDFTTLACCIKQRLVPTRKMEDPKVRIQISFSDDLFNLMKRIGMVLERQIRGSQVYGIQQYEDPDELLGEQWHLRVVSINGNFSCALLSVLCHASQIYTRLQC